MLENMVRTCLSDALVCLQADPIYGSVLLSLVQRCIARVDVQEIAWALSLEGLVDASHALFFHADPPAEVENQPQNGPSDETEIFRQAVTQHIPLAERLRHLSQSEDGDVCRVACVVRTFILLYLDLIQRPLRIPFFLHELLRISIACINWHHVAAQIYHLPETTSCSCEACVLEEPLGAKAEYLGELFRLVGDEIIQHSQDLPEPQCTQALFLMDLC